MGLGKKNVSQFSIGFAVASGPACLPMLVAQQPQPKLKAKAQSLCDIRKGNSNLRMSPEKARRFSSAVARSERSSRPSNRVAATVFVWALIRVANRGRIVVECAR